MHRENIQGFAVFSYYTVANSKIDSSMYHDSLTIDPQIYFQWETKIQAMLRIK